MQTPQPIAKDVVLIGGGHSHAIVLRMWGMNPLPGVRLTLITEASDTPYTGMLPGYVAGFYRREDCYIDLRSLAQFAQAQLYLDRAVGLDLDQNQVLCANRPPVGFDLLSIDIGSTPTLPPLAVPSASSIPAKPIREFLVQWRRVVERMTQHSQQYRLAIVGGGVGGVELSLAMQHHLHQILQTAGQPTENLEMHLVQRERVLLPGHSTWVQQRFQNILAERGIQVHLGAEVEQVRSGGERSVINCQSGLLLDCDYVFWVTQASAPDWLGSAGLAVDDRGFIQVQETLQSVSHPHVFAAGDVAAMVAHPRPKAGVFAVRQGKPLFQNLQKVLLGEPLRPYRPQKYYLNLIGTSDQSAIVSRGCLHGESRWLWQWKDQIDRQFMSRFRDLPPMAAMSTTQASESTLMYCAGCGSKVGSSILERVLARIQRVQPERQLDSVLIGLNAPDDAAVMQLPSDRVLVQTVDYFRTLTNDPFVFGQISANHALSDIFAMGATVHSALAIVTLPYALPAKLEETLYQLLSGAVKVLHHAGADLIGGHTTTGTELAFGLSCNGLAESDRLLRKSGMQPGQVLILTKALGTGTLFAAEMQRQTKPQWIDGAIGSMLQSNQAAATCFLQHGATACTDITGFGLMGHLLEMLNASQVSVELDLAAIPALDGALETLQLGIFSSLHSENHLTARYIQNHAQFSHHPRYSLLFDPQTSGGLLAAVPPEQVSNCLTSLEALGYAYSQPIARVVPREIDKGAIVLVE